MQEFEKHSACPKCRNGYIEKTFIPKTTEANFFMGDTFRKKDMLQIRCIACGYEWYQKTADAEGK